jgi:hypothetical protein
MSTPVNFTFSRENIFNMVKQEISLWAKLQNRLSSSELKYDDLAFLEDNITWFRPAFFDAQSEVLLSLAAYMNDVPAEPEYHEAENFTDCKDFVVWLLMPDTWNFHLAIPLETAIREFLTSYVCYKWLAHKNITEAATYRQQAEAAMVKIREIPNKRTSAGKIQGWMW